jgi:hypothetical protein
VRTFTVGETNEYGGMDSSVSDNTPEDIGQTRIIAQSGYHGEYKDGFDVYLSSPDFEIINIPGSSPFADEDWKRQRKAIEEFKIKENLVDVEEGMTMPLWGSLPPYRVKERDVNPSGKFSMMVTTLYKGNIAYLVYTGNMGTDMIELNRFGGSVKRQNIGIGVKDGRSTHLIKYLKDWEKSAKKGDTDKMSEVWRKLQNGYKGIYDYTSNPQFPPHLAIAARASKIEYIT